MRYWLTTHWPPETPEDQAHKNVFLQEQFADLTSQMQAGDKVLIYECKTGKARLNSAGKPIRKMKGRGEIVTVAEVASPFEKKPQDFGSSEHSDGKARSFSWVARTRAENRDGSVPLADVNRILQYKPGYRLRGFGKRGSGLGEISAPQFDELVKVFRAKSRA